MTFETKLTEFAEVYLSRYVTHKYGAECTPWTFSFYWNGTTIDTKIYSADNPFCDLIPQTLGRIEKSLTRPEKLLPKATSIPLHYSALARSNRDELEKMMFLTLSRTQYSKTVEFLDAISDSLLVTEALENYLSFSQRKPSTSTDIITFLRLFDVNSTSLLEDNMRSPGSYGFLVARLVQRFGVEHVMEGIYSYVSAVKRTELELFDSITEQSCVDPRMRAIYSQVTKQAGDPPATPKRIPRIFIAGRRRKSQSSPSNVDWSTYVSEEQLVAYTPFGPNDVMAAVIERELTTNYLNDHPQGVSEELLARLAKDIVAADPEMQVVLGRILEKFKLMQGFETYNIKHSMQLPRIGNNHDKK